MADYLLSDLLTVVPAVRPAWLKITLTALVEHQWSETVLPVLAYAVLHDGLGAYMVNGYQGPCWIPSRQIGGEKDGNHGWCIIDLALFVGEKPDPPIVLLRDEYVFEPRLDLWAYLDLIGPLP